MHAGQHRKSSASVKIPVLEVNAVQGMQHGYLGLLPYSRPLQGVCWRKETPQQRPEVGDLGRSSGCGLPSSGLMQGRR